MATDPSCFLLYQESQSVDYQYWNANYPYDSMKYSGEVNNWVYTINPYDANPDYYPYYSWFIDYLNPDYAQYTIITVKMPSYTPNEFWLQRGSDGTKITNVSCSGGYCTYTDSNSQNIGSYEMVTQKYTSNGSADLYNTVFFNRRNY